MFYTSTRDKSVRVTASEAITKGISSDGGLFVPTEIPKISEDFIKELIPLSYIERAKKVLSLYLTDFTAEEISTCVEGAYKKGKFSSDKVSTLYKLADGEYVLELWRGPTCAFKDMALQLLPYLLTTASNKTLKDTEIVILVATSGDTGKAALEGMSVSAPLRAILTTHKAASRQFSPIKKSKRNLWKTVLHFLLQTQLTGDVLYRRLYIMYQLTAI